MNLFQLFRLLPQCLSLYAGLCRMVLPRTRRSNLTLVTSSFQGADGSQRMSPLSGRNKT
jgi:hypothetical protein